MNNLTQYYKFLDTKMFIKMRGKDGKLPAEAWKQSEFRYTINELTIQGIDNLGFVPPDNHCIIDCDDEQAIQIVERVLTSLNRPTCFSWNTTKGKHFLFKFNPTVPIVNLPTSLVGPNRNGWNATWDYRGLGKGCVKITKRITPIRIVEMLSDESLPELPECLYPLRRQSLNFTIFNRGERDDTIFREWLPILQRELCGDYDVLFKVLTQVIQGYHNDDEFDGNVIKTKILSSFAQGEIKSRTPARTMTSLMKMFEQDKAGRISRVTNYDDLYKHLIERFNLWMTADNIVWYYDINKRIYLRVKHLTYLIHNYLAKGLPNFAPNLIDPVMKGLEAYIDLSEIDDNPYRIVFTNGVYDVKLQTFTPEDTPKFNPNIIPWEYVKLDKTTEAYRFVQEILDALAYNKPRREINTFTKAQILELIGLSMTKITLFDAAYFLFGKGQNGKSILLRVLEKLLGRHNISNEDLVALSNNAFSSSNMYLKLVNINGDISTSTIKDPSFFKKATSGDSVSAQEKHQPAYQYNPYATLILGCNNIPKYVGEGFSIGVDRRIYVIPFENEFERGGKVFKYFYEHQWAKLTSEPVIQTFIGMGIEAICKVVESYQLTINPRANEIYQEYKQSSDTVYDFWIYKHDIGSDLDVMQIYDDYKMWANQRSFKIYSYSSFKTGMEKYYYANNFDLELTKNANNEDFWTIRLKAKEKNYE